MTDKIKAMKVVIEELPDGGAVLVAYSKKNEHGGRALLASMAMSDPKDVRKRASELFNEEFDDLMFSLLKRKPRLSIWSRLPRKPRPCMDDLQRAVHEAQAKHKSARNGKNTQRIHHTQKKLHAANHALMKAQNERKRNDRHSL